MKNWTKFWKFIKKMSPRRKPREARKSRTWYKLVSGKSFKSGLNHVNTMNHARNKFMWYHNLGKTLFIRKTSKKAAENLIEERIVIKEMRTLQIQIKTKKTGQDHSK